MNDCPADTDDEQLSGINLVTLPVVADYGFSDFVYLGVADQLLPVTSANPLRFDSLNAFAALQIPQGAAGTYQIQFNGVTHAVSGGTVFDFAALVPGGVDSFRFWPTDPAEPIRLVAAGLDAVGFRFASEGPTNVFQSQVVPEPSGLLLAACAGFGFLLAIAQRRTRQSKLKGLTESPGLMA